jgi:DNA-binding NarL/FixJ family response regulator
MGLGSASPIAMTLSVLVVDDHELWRRQVRAALKDYRRWSIVAEASNGFEAIEKAAALRPDLILLDIGLPVLSGIVAARQILANDPQSRIMFMTAIGSPGMVEAAMRMGVRGYLLKSDAHQLVAAMDAISQGQAFISEGLTRGSDI